MAILPDFERLWAYVERCSHLPAFLILDSIDALALHYGLEPWRLVTAVQRDLVDTGYAHAVFVSEEAVRPAWTYLMDGVVSWLPLRLPVPGPHWILTIDYLAGRESRQQRYVMALRDGGLVCYPSDDEMSKMLDRATWRPRARAVPAEIVEFLCAPDHESTTGLY